MCQIVIGKSEDWLIYRATTKHWRRIWTWFLGHMKRLWVQIGINTAMFWLMFEVTSKFVIAYDIEKHWGLTDLPGHHGKWTKDMNLIFRSYKISLGADRDYCSSFIVFLQATSKFAIVYVKLILGKNGVGRFTVLRQ